MISNDFATKTILIIDDFNDMRSVLKNILRAMGANKIDQAADGDEALLAMMRRRYDIVLCDYNLGPRKDGQQVLDEARQKQLVGIDTIFIMVTAENTREMVMGAVEYVPDGYLTKPVTKELLETRLKKLLQRKADLKPVSTALLAHNYGLALQELDQLMATRPRNLPDLIRLRSEICLDARRYDEAMAIFDHALQERDLSWAKLGRGKVYYFQKNYEQARTVFSEIIAQDRNLIAAYDWLAKTHIALKSFDEAEKVLTTAVEISPRVVHRQKQLGEVALSNNSISRAEAAFGRAVALSQHSIHKHPSLISNLAMAKSASSKHDEALRLLKDIGKQFGHDPEAAFFQSTAAAQIYHNRGDTEKAQQAASKAQDLLGTLSDNASPAMSLELARVHLSMGDQAASDKILGTIIANNHDDEDFLHQVSQVFRSEGDDDQAEQRIQAIRQEVVRTNNSGVRLIRDGKIDEAVALLRKAATDMPGNKTINLNAAKALIMQMEKTSPTQNGLTAAREHIDRVQRLAPEDWRIADVLNRLNSLSRRL